MKTSQPRTTDTMCKCLELLLYICMHIFVKLSVLLDGLTLNDAVNDGPSGGFLHGTYVNTITCEATRGAAECQVHSQRV